MGATGILTALGAAGTMANSYQQSQAIKAQARYQSSMLESNRRLADIQAEDAIKRGKDEALKVKRQTKQIVGAQRAAMAAQGLDLGADDALAIQEETRQLGAEDAQTVKNNAWREAWGYRVQAENYSNQATMTSLAAKNEARNTLLTGGLSAARQIAGYNQYDPYRFLRRA